MSGFAVAFLITLGAGFWMFNKLQKYSGNNTKQSAMAAGAAGLFIFIVLGFVLNKLLG